jgi:phosphoribosylaminoimidazole-succinocarboxamide synthase
MGSVKDLFVIESACENRPGVGNFVFSDRYSVFDWGEMPDRIPSKGRALAVMAAFSFEELEKRGIRTHYQGLVNEKGGVVRFADLKEARGGEATMQVSLARVYHPVLREFFRDGELELCYDYSFFERNRGTINNYLLGLEIIFRNGVPLGSSVLKKLEEAGAVADPRRAEAERRRLLRELGLKEVPKPGDMLPGPVMSFTTKLEPGDRSLSDAEAYRISGLRRRDFGALKRLALAANEAVSELARRAGFAHYDGKIEAVWDRGLLVCDVLGTFDENRFAWEGEQVSKEVLRQWYRRNQPEFPRACEKWKKSGSGWQGRSDVKPRKLPKAFVTLVSQMYMAGCNRYTGRAIFKAPGLGEVMARLREQGG